MCLYCLNTISKIFFKERLKYSSLGNTWTTMQALGSTEGRYTPVGGLRPGFEPGLCIPWLTTSSESTGGIHCYELPNVHTMGLDTQNIGVGKHRREGTCPSHIMTWRQNWEPRPLPGSRPPHYAYLTSIILHLLWATHNSKFFTILTESSQSFEVVSRMIPIFR